MRVLAVAHGLHQLAGEGAPLRRLVAQGLGEPGRDRRIIGRGARIGPRRQPLAQIEARGPGLLQLGQHLLHVGDLGADGDIAVVLGRRADHRRAADVDVLHRRCVVRARRDRRLEGIEVHIDQIDAADRMVGHGLGVVG